MTFKEKLAIEHPENISDSAIGGVYSCPYLYDYEKYEDRPCADTDSDCTKCWNREITQAIITSQKIILDSGERRQFETGAVRDIQEGKGRCDLMPLWVVGACLENTVLMSIANYQKDGDVTYLKDAIGYFNNNHYECPYTMFLEVSKHFEEGAKKYGENNWQKGIPTRCYIDSAVRHYLKHLRGDQDEPHDRAFVWNLLCCMWTVINKPELDSYRKDEENGD